ncbi:MAG TPA: outer membrane beta-barrel protein [Geobacteraceae bacterium]|nr:outer membrane beta-barrel protein [Geobacteraceae bacterium]
MSNLMAALSVALLVLTTATAHAGEKDGAFTVSPFVGGYTFDGAEKLETRPMVGLRLGYNIIAHFALEATFNYVSTRFSEPVPGTVDVFNYRLEGIINFIPEGRVVPYLAIGGGGSTINMPITFIISNYHHHSPTANAGFGAKWFFSENMAVRADYHQNLVINTDVVGNKRHDGLANYEYSVGLQFSFGGGKPFASLSLEPGTIRAGESATLFWRTQKATNCVIRPGLGPVGAQGNITVSPPADTTYELTCDSKAGTLSSMAVITVSAANRPSPAPASGKETGSAGTK